MATLNAWTVNLQQKRLTKNVGIKFLHLLHCCCYFTLNIQLRAIIELNKQKLVVIGQSAVHTTNKQTYIHTVKLVGQCYSNMLRHDISSALPWLYALRMLDDVTLKRQHLLNRLSKLHIHALRQCSPTYFIEWPFLIAQIDRLILCRLSNNTFSSICLHDLKRVFFCWIGFVDSLNTVGVYVFTHFWSIFSLHLLYPTPLVLQRQIKFVHICKARKYLRLTFYYIVRFRITFRCDSSLSVRFPSFYCLCSHLVTCFATRVNAI